MNGNSIVKFGIMIGSILFSLFIVISTFTSQGNQIGQLLKWFILIGPAIGFLAPKGAMILFFVLQFYFDFIKRLLIIGEATSMNDVMFALGVGPALVASVCASCVLGALGGRHSINRRDVLFLIGCFLVSFLGVSTADGTGIVDLGQAVLGSSMIGMAAFATSILFRERDDVVLFFRTIMLAAIPMGAYTFWQWYGGIPLWEATYILRGFSSSLYIHYMNHLESGDPMRPYSTLNLHVSVGAVAGTLLSLAILIGARLRQFSSDSKLILFRYIFIGIFFGAVCIYSTNRTTYFLFPFACVMAWSFKGGLRTILFYAVSASAALTLIFNSESIDEVLLEWDAIFRSTAFGEWFGTIGTYTDRLKSFMMLTNSDTWRPFGFPASQRPLTHDPITAILVSIGYVPMIAAFMVAFAALVFWHRSVLAMPDPRERWLSIQITAVVGALSICGMAYGNVIFVAPVNSLLGSMIGLAYCSYCRSLSTTPADILSRELKAAVQGPQIISRRRVGNR